MCAVIVDQFVPGLGLRQFIDALDGTPACAAIPVIVASGAPLDTDIAKRVAHYLVKPYDPDALLRSVAEHCARPVPRP